MRASLLVLALALAGCATHVVHPGAANQYDSDSYDAVLVAHSVIETTKTDLANNAFPATLAPNVKAALNGLISAYDIADKAYTVYHNAALAGQATTQQSNELTADLKDMQAKTAALTSAKALKP